MGDRLSRRRGLTAVVALGVGAGVLAGCSGGAPAAGDALPACSSLDGENVSLVVPYEPTPHVFRPRVRYQNEFPIGGTDVSLAIADEVPEARQISEAPPSTLAARLAAVSR